MKIIKIIKSIIKSIYIDISAIYYCGNSCYCPCCNKIFRKFRNFNYKKKIYNPKIYESLYKNTICPYCLSLPKHRIICEFLKQNKKKIMDNKKILIFASETGTELYLKRNNINFKTADLYQTADLKIDITNIDLRNESFDVIICNHVLEHVDNYKKALNELNRILTRNGFLILTVPIDKNSKEVIEKKFKSDEERKEFYGQSDHLRNFGLNTKSIIEKYGFIVEEINGDIFDERIIPVTGPGKYDYNHIFICYKK